MSFDAPLASCRPLRRPRRMPAGRSHAGHSSPPDAAMAGKPGFGTGPVEGPARVSRFERPMERIRGREWFGRGCRSVHLRNMVMEGEAVRAFAERPEVRAFEERPEEGARRVRARAEKADGTPAPEAGASVGDGPTPLSERMEGLAAPGRLVLPGHLRVGRTGAAEERVRMEPDRHMGGLRPFSLDEKLEKIAERAGWASDASASPRGRAAIPLGLLGVPARYADREAGLQARRPSAGLFADLEIRMVEGPPFVDEDCRPTREVLRFPESRRTGSARARTRIRRGDAPAAEALPRRAVPKRSVADCEEERATA